MSHRLKFLAWKLEVCYFKKLYLYLYNSIDIPIMVMKPNLLRYVGSKQKLIGEIEKHINRLPLTNFEWIEPFCGSLIVPLHFLNDPRITHFHLNDLNSYLIRFFKDLQMIDNLDNVIVHLNHMIGRFADDKNVYYEYRDKINSEAPIPCDEYIALFLLINRTCFNGVSRYNKKGKFNVPIGKTATNWDNIQEKLHEVHQQLKELRYKITFHNDSYESFVQKMITTRCRNYFLYCDPPYDSTFSMYNDTKFEGDDQTRLCALLQAQVVPFLLHNSNTERIQTIYNTNNQFEVVTRRSVSQTSSSRGIVTELIVTNY
jgi:DNA adenine methylase